MGKESSRWLKTAFLALLCGGIVGGFRYDGSGISYGKYLVVHMSRLDSGELVAFTGAAATTPIVKEIRERVPEQGCSELYYELVNIAWACTPPQQ